MICIRTTFCSHKKTNKQHDTQAGESKSNAECFVFLIISYSAVLLMRLDYLDKDLYQLHYVIA